MLKLTSTKTAVDPTPYRNVAKSKTHVTHPTPLHCRPPRGAHPSPVASPAHAVGSAAAPPRWLDRWRPSSPAAPPSYRAAGT